MQFNQKVLSSSKDRSEINIKFKHVGKLPTTIMAHNIVVADITLATDGIIAGIENEMCKTGK
ncbi:hypothetical protein [Pseudoalteromonas sp.]|uniref:hypothetical protein n=1 Tax=Pseudoalteromonas sp. TaxID=53249 RepID=UPI0035618850